MTIQRIHNPYLREREEGHSSPKDYLKLQGVHQKITSDYTQGKTPKKPGTFTIQEIIFSSAKIYIILKGKIRPEMRQKYLK